MRALAYSRFGAIDVLHAIHLPVPPIPSDGVLVKVRATSVNVIDSRTRRGEMAPFVNKKFPKVPGVDFAGTVTQVGARVKRLKVGDAVYGATNPFKGGAFAEFVVARENTVAAKPASLSFEEAAALPIAALAALATMRDLGKVRDGQQVLIYGSSGGVGLLAIQLARHFGARVTGVCGANGVQPSRDAGASIAYDYASGPLPLPDDYDVIADYSGHFPFRHARRHLASRGRFIESSPTIPRFLGSMIANPFRRQKHLMLTAQSKSSDLDVLSALVDAGKLNVAVAKVFDFDAAQEAFRLQEAGGVVGKVVVRIADSAAS